MPFIDGHDRCNEWLTISLSSHCCLPHFAWRLHARILLKEANSFGDGSIGFAIWMVGRTLLFPEYCFGFHNNIRIDATSKTSRTSRCAGAVARIE